MDSDTMISDKKDTPDAITTMRKTPLLCQVTDPEEKRRIIGDTFMRVANEVSIYVYLTNNFITKLDYDFSIFVEIHIMNQK